MNKKTSFTWLFLLLVTSAIFAQTDSISPYLLDLKTDLLLNAAGFGLCAGGYLLEQKVEPYSLDQIDSLPFRQPTGFDAKAIKHFSAQADCTSDWLLRGSAVLPLTLLADKTIRRDAPKIAVLLSESASLTLGLTMISKSVFKRDRPYVFNPQAPLNEKTLPDARLSFFSGHTSMSACMSFFTAKVWSDYHPDSPWKPLVWTAAAALPAVTGYLRYDAGRHYFTDVVTGYAVGALVGYFIPHLHKVDTSSKRKLRFSSSTFSGAPVLVAKYRF